MKLVVNAGEILACLQPVLPAVPARTPRDILKSVALRLRNSCLTLHATDGELAIATKMAVAENGSAGWLIEALPLSAILQTFRRDQDVTLQSNGDKIVISCAGSKFVLPTADVDGFPPYPAVPSESAARIPADHLHSGLSLVYAADETVTRHALGGVAIDLLDNGSICFVGCDTKRMAVARFSCEQQLTKTVAIVPRKAAEAIVKVVRGDINQHAIVQIDDSGILVSCGDCVVSSPLVRGVFPRWRQAVPANSAMQTSFVAGPLLDRLRQSALMTNEESFGVSFLFEKDELILSSSGRGESTVSMPLDCQGLTIRSGFNPHYWIDFLRRLDPAETVGLELPQDDGRAVLLTSGCQQYVIMPCVLGKE